MRKIKCFSMKNSNVVRKDYKKNSAGLYNKTFEICILA